MRSRVFFRVFEFSNFYPLSSVTVEQTRCFNTRIGWLLLWMRRGAKEWEREKIEENWLENFIDLLVRNVAAAAMRRKDIFFVGLRLPPHYEYYYCFIKQCSAKAMRLPTVCNAIADISPNHHIISSHISQSIHCVLWCYYCLFWQSRNDYVTKMIPIFLSISLHIQHVRFHGYVIETYIFSLLAPTPTPQIFVSKHPIIVRQTSGHCRLNGSRRETRALMTWVTVRSVTCAWADRSNISYFFMCVFFLLSMPFKVSSLISAN